MNPRPDGSSPRRGPTNDNVEEMLEQVAVPDAWRGEMSLRWVMVHMVEEYARHNGHADLLRERIDGRIGQ